MNIEGLTIRRAAPADASGIASLEHECFGDEALPLITIVQYLELFAASSLVAIRSERCVGALIAGASVDDPGCAWVLDLAVHPQAQGKGLASAMLGRVLVRFRDHGVGEVRATVSPKNAPSLALFSRAGFVIERTEPAYFGAGEVRHILRLELESEPRSHG
ncbi:MAG TPA: GNAT family N-acetyltransferase [Thermoanaerobaculia bacterium]